MPSTIPAGKFGKQPWQAARTRPAAGYAHLRYALDALSRWRGYVLDPLVERALELPSDERCLEAARLAPSAGNGQPWRFAVVDDPELRSAVAAAAINEILGINRFVSRAPVLVAVVMEPTRPYVRIGGALKGQDYRPFDIGMAVMQFCLQAEEEGLGTCIIGWFDERKVRRLLGMPRGRRVPLLIALGRPREEEGARAKQRKGREEIRSYNRYR